MSAKEEAEWFKIKLAETQARTNRKARRDACEKACEGFEDPMVLRSEHAAMLGIIGKIAATALSQSGSYRLTSDFLEKRKGGFIGFGSGLSGDTEKKQERETVSASAGGLDF